MRRVVIRYDLLDRLTAAGNPVDLAGTCCGHKYIFGRVELTTLPSVANPKMPRVVFSDPERLAILCAGTRRVELADPQGRPVGVVTIDECESVDEDFDARAAKPPGRTYTTAEVLAYCKARAAEADAARAKGPPDAG